jgi:hypothetical protein
MTVRILAMWILLSSALIAAPVSAQGDEPSPTGLVKKPAVGTVHHALIEGLKLIEEGEFDGWIAQWCSVSKLCYNDNARKALKKYNLPARKRTVSACLKGERDSVQVTRMNGDPAKDDAVKLFIQCSEDSMPRPFSLHKSADGWRFTKI